MSAGLRHVVPMEAVAACASIIPLRIGPLNSSTTQTTAIPLGLCATGAESRHVVRPRDTASASGMAGWHTGEIQMKGAALTSGLGCRNEQRV